jgi:hypothetical protein
MGLSYGYFFVAKMKLSTTVRSLISSPVVVTNHYANDINNNCEDVCTSPDCIHVRNTLRQIVTGHAAHDVVDGPVWLKASVENNRWVDINQRLHWV